MKTIDRRTLLTTLGIAGGATALGVHQGAGGADSQPADASSPTWHYTPLDPQATSDLAYQYYADGGCMYAVVTSVIRQLAELHGEPFRSFPCEMMRYGAGGVGEWGSLCGVVNGAMALAGMFCSEKEKPRREALASEFCQWYESTALPSFSPAEPLLDCPVPKAVSGSVLCHVSVAKWCQESGCEAFSPEKKERCRRLAADGAKKIVEMLNAAHQGTAAPAPTLSPAVASCVACHGKEDMANANGHMSCQTCHDIDESHP
ncbi:C-GCAxxG-C-C family protein [Aeoliella mucimassa]|uniref:Split-Soret cytochrome c n=1 Tax=Aeoliella mucimassa TaxID=2527972 RepID=A0A518AS00_9BACT|nr:C-GCAxxG-C-C family protein [Aeoliella mucimassa]QDU57502.1 Split-Soret cytochrome c precursor [Aeoliella mucimassa]